MSKRRYRITASIAALSVIVCCTWSAWAGLPVKLSSIISAADLEADIAAKMSEVDTALVSQDSFQETSGKLRLAAVQLAVLSQALAEHDENPKPKSAAPAMRDAAMTLAQASTFEQATVAAKVIRSAIDGQTPANPKIEYDWAKLARLRSVMESLRDRTDHVRKALRKSKDPATESRQAAVMAVLALSIAAHSDNVKNPSDRSTWNELSLQFQSEMVKTATALRSQDKPAVLEHFKAAQETCDRCHEKFKK